MKKISDKRHEASFSERPRSAPSVRQSPAKSFQDIAESHRISETSAKTLILNAQSMMAKIVERRRRMSPLPLILSLRSAPSAATLASNDAERKFPCFSKCHSAAQVDSVADECAVNQVESSNSKSLHSSKKLRPISAALGSRSVPNALTCLQPSTFTTASSIIRYFMSPNHGTAFDPKKGSGGDAKSIYGLNAHTKFNKGDSISRLKRACSVASKRPEETLTLLHPIFHQASQDLDQMQTPEIVLAAAIVVQCSEVYARIQELQDWFHNAITKIRKESSLLSLIEQSDMYNSESKTILFEIQKLHEKFLAALSQCGLEQQCVEELRAAHSMLMKIEVQDSSASFEASAFCSAMISAADDFISRLLLLQQETNAMFVTVSSSFVSSFLETCALFQSIAELSIGSLRTKSTVPLPLSPDDDKNLKKVTKFLQNCKTFPLDSSKFLFIRDCDRSSIASGFSKAEAACTEFFEFYKQYAAVIESHQQNELFQKSFEKSLQNHQFLDASRMLCQIEQNCSLISQTSSNDLVSQCQRRFDSVQLLFEKDITQVRDQLHLAQQSFTQERDDLQLVYGHIEAAQTAMSNIRCFVPERTALNVLVAKVKSAESRRYWHAKSSVQFGLSSVSETVTKCWDDFKSGTPVLENLAKLEAAITSLRNTIDKFSIDDDGIINQVHALQGSIDDLNVIASGSRLEPLELIYSNCLQDFHKLVNESDELHQLEHGIRMLKQIQYRLKRFYNRSSDTSTNESSTEMCNQCDQEISRIELLRGKHLFQLKIEVESLKELLARSSAQDESENIPQLHSRILYVRQVANAIDDQAALVEIVDLCRKCALLVEHRDNWLRSKVLVSLSAAEGVFRNRRSEIPDLIAAIENLKENHVTVTKIMSSAVQIQTTSKIERTVNHLKSCLILIQDDQEDKKKMLEDLNSKLTRAISSYHDGFDDDASFSIMLDLQSKGIDLRKKIHIDAEDSLEAFDRFSLLISKIHQRREQLSSMIAEANSLSFKIDQWLAHIRPLPSHDLIDFDFKPLLLPLQKASLVIISLHMYDTQDIRNIARRLQSLVSDVLVFAADEMTKFLSNARRDVAAVEQLLASSDFTPAVSIVDSLKDNISCHQITLLHLKFCYKTMFKFYKHEVAPFLASTRLLEFDLLRLIQHFDRSSHELPMLRDGVLAQGNALLNEAHLACLARKADLAREKLRLAVLCLAKVCKPEQWQTVSENIHFLERRCFSEAAAAAALCKMSQTQSKLHNYNVALDLLLAACDKANHWNLNRHLIISTYQCVVSSAAEFLSGVCSASSEIWDRFERIMESGVASCQGENLISVVLGIVQHHKLMRDLLHSRLLGDESLVWDDVLKADKPVRANLWNSSLLQMSPDAVGMTKEVIVIIENLEKRDERMRRSSQQVLTLLSNSIKASLHDNGFLSAVRCKISDAICERRLDDASATAREVIVSIVTAGVSPDYIMSIYGKYGPLSDCLRELENSEPAFRIPYSGISLPHVLWLPPKTIKLDAETSAIVAIDIAHDLNACLQVCCCALAENEMQALEFEILSSENKNNIGFVYSAAALAPGAFFEVLLSRNSCQLDLFQTPDGLTLLHFAACYCNEQCFKILLENRNNPDIIFAVDCFGRNALHFIIGANRELLGVSEATICSIYDVTYSKWMSLQECIANFCPESRGVATMGGFHDLSRHSPRHTRSNQDLDIVFRILQRDISQHLDRFVAPDVALNNVMHYIARRSIKGHKAHQVEHVEAKTRSSRLFGNLHSSVALPQDQVVNQERKTRDLASLHQIFQIFQKPFCLSLLSDENMDGMTPLLLACSLGNSTVVALFILQLGADVLCCDLSKRTPLHFAAELDDRHSFQLLLKCSGIEALANKDDRRQSSLFRATCLGLEFLFAESIKILNSTGSMQVAKNSDKKVDARNRRRGSTMAVAQQGKQALQPANEMNNNLKSILRDENDINNNSLLHAAAFSGSEVICSELLAAGLAPNKMNDLALTPLHIAAIRGHAACLDILAKSLLDCTKSAHPELDASVLQALLMLPEAKTTCANLKTLILAVSQLSGVDIDKHLHNGCNLALAAVFAGRGDIVQALAELKAKSCVSAQGSASVAHACAFFNRSIILSILCSKGVECCSVDAFRRTPLHMCMINGSREAAVLLVQMKQYPVRAKDDFGITAVNYLVVELLKSAIIDRSGLKLDVSKHTVLVGTVMAVVKICPEVLLDPLPCGISVFHLLATDSTSEVVEILQQFSAAIGEVVYAMPSNPFDARIVPVPLAQAFRSNQIAAQGLSNGGSRIDNSIWMQPFLRPGDTPAMVAVRCCNTAALSIIVQFALHPNKKCSCRSPLAQALQPRLQQNQKHCAALAHVLLVHSSGGFDDLYDAKIVAAAIARHAGLYKNLLLKPSPLLEKLKSYKALTAAPCFRFKRNAMCQIFLWQPLATIQQVISVMHSGNFVQVNPELVCDLNGNSILHHIFMKHRSESHVLGLWNFCLSIMEPSAKEQLVNLRNLRGKTLLHKVCRFSSVRTVQVVIRALFDQPVIDYAVLFGIPKQSSCSPFSRALKHGNVVLVQFLLSLDIATSMFQNLDGAILSQSFEALLGPKSSLQKLQTLSNRCVCHELLRTRLPSVTQLETLHLQKSHYFKVTLKRCMLKSSKFRVCASFDETIFQPVAVQLDVSEISNMFESIPFRESAFPPRIQLPQFSTQCAPRQLRISQTWDKVNDLFVSMNDAMSNFDSTALSFNSQKSILQLSQLPDPSNVFVLSIVWFNLSNVISNILCHHAAKLEIDFAAFNFSGDFTQRLRFLIEVGQDAPNFCRPDANLIHRTLGMDLDEVDTFIASQVSISNTVARACANAALILETLSVFIKCLEHANDAFANASHFVLERLSLFMNQENPTPESLLSACSKIPPLVYSYVQCCYFKSMAKAAVESIGLSEQSVNDLLLESEEMQNAFKTITPFEVKSYGSWKSTAPQKSEHNLDNFYYIDFKSCISCSNGLDLLKHLVCMTSPLHPRDVRSLMIDLGHLFESKSPSADVIESCISMTTNAETAKVFSKEDTQQISYLCASAKQFERMKMIIETTYSSLATCELLINRESFYSASEMLSSIKKSLEEVDIFERVIASKLSTLGSSCAVGMQTKKDNCDYMLNEAVRVLADAAGLRSIFIQDVSYEDADIMKCNLKNLLLHCDALSDLIKTDTCIPRHQKPWCKVPTTQEKLNSSLSTMFQIIDDVKRIACSQELLRICRVFEGKGVSLLPSAVIHLSLDPLKLGPLLPVSSQSQVEKWLAEDTAFCQLLVSDMKALNDWMLTSNDLAMNGSATSDNLMECIPKLQPLKETALSHLRHIIDIGSFIQSGTVDLKADCIDILKSYFRDSDSCDAIINFVTKESSELYQVLRCIVDSNTHLENLAHHCKYFKTLESAQALQSIKSRITALNAIVETILQRERDEAAIKIQRIARGVLVRRLSRVEVASSISISKEEFKWERQCSVRSAFASKIVNELLENVCKLKGLTDVKYRYDPLQWRDQFFRRCQAAVKVEKQLFNAFFSVCQKLDHDATAYESLDEPALRMAALDVKEIRLSYSKEDWLVARREFCIDIESIESKLLAVTSLCVHHGEVSRCVTKLRAAQANVRRALDSGNHLLAIDHASFNWDINSALSSSELVIHEVEVLRSAVAESFLIVSADKEHLDKLAGAYTKSLNIITFLMEQSQYEDAHRCIVKTFSDLDEFKALADRFACKTVRNEDIPQLDFSAVSRLQSVLLIVTERDRAIEQIEAQDHCIGGSYDKSYALINHVSAIMIDLDSNSHSALSGPLVHVRERVDDVVRLMFRELRRIATAIKTERANFLNASPISIIQSHHYFLDSIPFAIEYAAKVGQISVDELSRVLSTDFTSQNAQETDPTWWANVQQQLLEELQLLDALSSLHCPHLKDAPDFLTQYCDRHTSKLDFVCSSSSFIQRHLVPMTNISSGQLPLPSLVSHIDLNAIVPALLDYIHVFISEFDRNCSTLLSNTNQLSLFYSKSKRQLDTLVADSVDGKWDLSTLDTFSLIRDDFEKCELLVVRTLSLLDFFPPAGLPVRSEHLRWFKLNAATGSKAAQHCISFIEKVSVVQEGISMNPTRVAGARVRTRLFFVLIVFF